MVDGAYHRELIIGELNVFKKIIAARPCNTKWIAKLPSNYLESQTLQIAMWMNGSVDSQIEAIELMNRIIKQKGNTVKLDGRDLHPIEIVRAEMRVKYGFFDFFVETLAYFNEGLRVGCWVANHHLGPLDKHISCNSCANLELR